MKKNAIILLALLNSLILNSQPIRGIDNKGNIKIIDASKWAKNLLNIFNQTTVNIGIGTVSPGNRLEITTRAAGTSGLRLTNLPNANFLSTNSNGDVISASNINNLPISGDITGTISATTVTELQGRAVSSTTPTEGQLLSWNNITNRWEPTDDPSLNNWLFSGNTTTNNSNFLGTLNDVKMQIRANNIPVLEFGRRQTLGLYNAVGNFFPYNQTDASVTFVRGVGGVSALELESDASSTYTPVIYTDNSGNFLIKGSANSNDFFELGSSGTNNNGRLLVTIGDEGDEPIIFNKHNSSAASSSVEMMRMQGTGANTIVRTGINLAGSVPNSTFQVKGSVSKPIFRATSNITLNETHHTVLVAANITVTLPAASSLDGRIYILKNLTAQNITVSTYVGLDNINSTIIPNNSVIWVQSDGANWQRIK